MADESAQHHGNNGAALEGFGCSVSQEDGNEIENDVAGGVHDDVGAVGGIKTRHLGENGQQTFDQAGSSDGRNQRGEDFSDLLQDHIAQALFLGLNGFFLVGRGRGSLAAQQSNRSVIDLGNFCTANHLELTAGNHNGDHTFQMLNHLFVGFALVLQNKAQPGKAVGDLLHICLAADIVKNVLGNFLVVHCFPPSSHWDG